MNPIFKKLQRIQIRKYQRIYLLSILIILVEFIIFSYLSYPPSPLYSMRKTSLTFFASFQTTHKSKAKIYLAETNRLQVHLDQLLKNKNSDQELRTVAKELLSVEQSAINEMDLASKAGINIKNEVEVLCDALIKQQQQLKQAIQNTEKIANSPLEQYATTTKILIDESPGW